MSPQAIDQKVETESLTWADIEDQRHWDSPCASSPHFSKCGYFPLCPPSFCLSLLLLLSFHWGDGDVSRNESERWRKRYLKSSWAVPPPSCSPLFCPTPLRSLFPAFSLCIPFSFSRPHTHTHRHTLKAVNVTNAVSVEPLLTSWQQLQWKRNQALFRFVLFCFVFFLFSALLDLSPLGAWWESDTWPNQDLFLFFSGVLHHSRGMV